MNMNMKIANVKSSAVQIQDAVTKSLERVLERTRMENASLQRDLVTAQAKAAGAVEQKALSEGQLTLVRAELAAARKAIADLEAKVKSVTASVEAQATAAKRTAARKDKQED